jgi:hypothetical protein
MKKIDRFFEDDDYELVLGWLDKRTYGLWESDKGKVTINFELLIMEVLIHELLHVFYEEMLEKAVVKKTRAVLEAMSVKDIRKYATLAMIRGKWQ